MKWFRFLKRKKFWKRVVIYLVLLPVFLFSILILVLYWKQDAIVQDLLTTLNKDFKGEIRINGSHISPFENFPYISIDLEGVEIYEAKKDTNHPILKVQDVYVGFNLFSIVSGKTDIKTIKAKTGKIFLTQHKDGSFNIANALSSTKPIARRVSIFKENGQRMNLSEMADTLGYILQHYRNGMLLIEDISKFITDSMPGDLIGSICTQRHVSVDVVIHVQTVGKLFNPKLWGNCNEVRLHKADDTVERHKQKISGNIEHLLIMEKLIELKYKSGDVRFCCYLDKDYGKIKGRFTKSEFKQAVELYLSSNYSRVLKPLLDKRDIYTGQLLYKNQTDAVNAYLDYLVSEYL